MAVAHEVEAARVEREVVGIHATIGDFVPTHGVVAESEASAMDERVLDPRQGLGRRRLELGAEGTHTDGVAHAVEEGEGVLAQDAPDLLEGRGERGTEHARRDQELAAHEERRELGQRQLERELTPEAVLHLPDGPPPIGLGLVIDGEAGALEHPEVAPDRADGALEVTRCIIHRRPGRSVEELQELPLPGELVATWH